MPTEHDDFSTPDDLDQVIQVVRPPHWLALGALGLLITVGLVASVAVPVPVTVRGEGILIDAGGILTVTSQTAGRLTRVLKAAGQRIEENDPVALLAQPRLEEELASRRDALERARVRRAEVERFHARASDVEKQTAGRERQALEQRRHAAREHVATLEADLATAQRLYGEEILSERQLNETRIRLNEASNELAAIEAELLRAAQKLTDLGLEQEREWLELSLLIGDLEHQVKTLESELERVSEVRSPYSGRVVEVKVNPGEIVERGEPLLSLLPGHGNETAVAVLYVPPKDGKKIEPGMPVELEPTSVRREEYGFLLGRVAWVAEVPSTTEGMMRVLQNAQLVEQLSHQSAPFEVRVELERDPSTASGYRWSSSGGPAMEIRVGTLLAGDVVVRRERPLALLVPGLRRHAPGGSGRP